MISRNILLKFLLLGVLSSLALAVDEKTAAEDDANSLFSSSDDEDLEESGRVAFVTVDTNGITVTFNATSLLLGALAALAVGAVAAAIAIPLAVVFGLKKKYYDYDDYSGYSSSGGYGDSGNSGYNEGGSSYTAYAKRSLEVMSPVMKALYSAYQKYSNEDENSVKL